MSKKNIITFKSVGEISFDVYEKPYPAKRAMPTWWKESKSLSQEEGFPISTFKGCSPMLDAISSGYIIPLFADIEVFQSDDERPIVRWNSRIDVAETHRDHRVNGLEIPEGFHPLVFKYNNRWIVKTPPGWSVLITHPFGYKNLPIHSFTGIADSDNYHGEINVPFVIKKGFSGVIPKGTPMCQVIPFKVESWRSEFIKGDMEEQHKISHMLGTKIYGGYTKLFRKIKEYN